MTGPIADLAPADRYRALAARFTEIVAAVPDDRWGSPSPCEGWSARDVVAHVVQSQRGYLDGAGEPLSPGPSVDDDPLGAWTATRDGVQQVLDDPTRARREVPGRAGSGPLEDTMGMFHSVDLVVHGWDLASSQGTPTTFTETDMDKMEASFAGFGEAMYAPGVFAEDLPVPDGASRQTRLLARMGRRG